MDQVLWEPDRVRRFTGHENLIYVFDPLALCQKSPRYGLAKLHRWAIFWSRFDFVMKQIDGSKNIFEDLARRWLKVYLSTKAGCDDIPAIFEDVIRNTDGLIEPLDDDICQAQQS